MIKMICLIKKKPGMSREELVKLWTEEHPKVSKKLGMEGYRVNIALEPQPGGALPPYDGTAEIWWKDEEFMRKALASKENEAAAADAARFCETLEFLHTEEFILV